MSVMVGMNTIFIFCPLNTIHFLLKVSWGSSGRSMTWLHNWVQPLRVGYFTRWHAPMTAQIKQVVGYVMVSHSHSLTVYIAFSICTCSLLVQYMKQVFWTACTVGTPSSRWNTLQTGISDPRRVDLRCCSSLQRFPFSPYCWISNRLKVSVCVRVAPLSLCQHLTKWAGARLCDAVSSTSLPPPVDWLMCCFILLSLSFTHTPINVTAHAAQVRSLPLARSLFIFSCRRLQRLLRCAGKQRLHACAHISFALELSSTYRLYDLVSVKCGD